jgi:coenzyme F420-0:L-glutamate ligase/coenzyme F420-1:gamma-L-glutamate ligase
MEVFAVDGLPEIREGDDLAALVRERVDLEPGDVVCAASTVVSKAEGRGADLADFPAGERARTIARRLSELTGEEKDPRFARAVLEESEELLLEAPFLLAVTRFGHITVNAGIDRSNVPENDLLLLPESPTDSARRLHEALSVPVVVTDTSGRPFRHGQRGVALGWAGMAAARDWRGERDMNGRELGVTVQAVVDELAGAANVVTGEGDGGTPVAVVRGFEFGDHGESDLLFRSAERDVVRQALREFRWSPEATTHTDGTNDPDDPDDPDPMDDADESDD